MKKTVIAGLLMTAFAAPAFALPAAPRSGAGLEAGNSAGTSAIQKVDRRRVCEWRHGNRHCWWVGGRDWDDRRWSNWRRDNWRQGFFFDGPGVSVRVR